MSSIDEDPNATKEKNTNADRRDLESVAAMQCIDRSLRAEIAPTDRVFCGKGFRQCREICLKMNATSFFGLKTQNSTAPKSNNSNQIKTLCIQIQRKRCFDPQSGWNDQSLTTTSPELTASSASVQCSQPIVNYALTLLHASTQFG